MSTPERQRNRQAAQQSLAEMQARAKPASPFIERQRALAAQQVANFEGELMSPQGEAAIEEFDAVNLPIPTDDEALFFADKMDEGAGNAEQQEEVMRRLRRFHEKFPGKLVDLRIARDIQNWEDANIDRSAVPSTFQEKQAAGRMGPHGHLFPVAKIEDYPSDSWEFQVDKAEKEGLDTRSGFGDDIWEVMDAARQFDSPAVRAGFMEIAVRSKLQEAGVEVPENYRVVKMHPDLNEPMFLKPTEDGKVRWTLADSNVFQFKDIGLIADPSDLLSMIGATAGAIVGGGHPFMAELGGDLLGRNLGLLIEWYTSRGLMEPGDAAKAFGIGLAESAGETLVSRGMDRFGARLIKGNRVFSDELDDAAKVERELSDTADMMEALEAMTGRAMAFTPAEATRSRGALRAQRMQEEHLGAQGQARRGGITDKNTAILKEATESHLGPRRPLDEPGFEVVETVPVAAKSGADKRNGEVWTTERTYDKTNPNVEYHTFKFVDDTSAQSAFHAEDGFDQGVRLVVDRAQERVFITDVFAGKKSQGSTALLMDKAWRKAEEFGYPVFSGDSVSPSAQRALEKQGWIVERANPDVTEVAANGNLFTTDGSPVFEVVGAPGTVQLNRPFREDGFDKMLIENELRTYEEALPAAQQWANESYDNLQSTIGWSQQRRTSRYHVENPRTSGLQTQLRAIQNRIDQSLTGAEESQATRLLRQAVRQAEDEEGERFLSGLAGDRLDLGNLINARAKMAEIAAKTKDPDAIRLVQTLDNLLKNGTVKTNKGSVMGAGKRMTLNQQIDAVHKSRDMVLETESFIRANNLFKKNTNGEYLYTTADQWERLLKGRGFFSTLSPVIANAPGVKAETAKVLRGVYRKKVHEGGWTRAKHNKFMSDYKDSIDHVFDPEDVAALERYELRGAKGDLWDRAVSRAQHLMERSRELTHPRATTPGPVDAFEINNRTILQAMEKGNWVQVKSHMRWVRENHPAQFAELQEVGRKHVQDHLMKRVFSGDEIKRSQAIKLTQWWKENGRAMRTLFGEEYYNQLGHIVRGVDQTTIAKSITDVRSDDAWQLPIKWFRTVFGVLTRPQRQLTAAQWTNARMTARAAVKVLNDPEAVRAIHVAQAEGLPVTAQAVIAALTRAGFFQELGIVGDPSSDEYQLQAQNAVKRIEDWIE